MATSKASGRCDLLPLTGAERMPVGVIEWESMLEGHLHGDGGGALGYEWVVQNAAETTLGQGEVPSLAEGQAAAQQFLERWARERRETAVFE